MEIVLTVMIIGVIIFAFRTMPRDWRGTRSLFSATSVILLAISLYIPFSAILALFAGHYTWAPGFYEKDLLYQTLGLSLAATVAFVFGNLLARKRNTSLRSNAIRSLGSVPNPILVLLVVVGLTIKLAMIVSVGGMEGAVIRLSSNASSAAGLAEFESSMIGMRTLSGMADGAATWGLIQALKGRKGIVAWSLALTMILAVSYLTTGKRLLFLIPVICVAIAIHVYVRPLTVRMFPALFGGMLAIGLVTLFARIFIPAAAAGISIDLGQVQYADGSALSFYFYSLEFSTIEMISVAISQADNIVAMFGGAIEAFATTNVAPLLYLVPRAIWSEKPELFLDLSYGISAALGSTHIEDPTVGYASTLVGTSFILSGPVGTVIVMLLLGIIASRIDGALLDSDWSIVRVFLYGILVVACFHFFRQGTLGWTFIVTIVQQLGLILSVVFLSVLSGRGSRSASLPDYREVAAK